jgi:hypothetical protein
MKRYRVWTSIFVLFVATFMEGCGTRIRLAGGLTSLPNMSIDLRPQADAIFGQSSYSRNEGNMLGLAWPSRPHFAAGKLFLADYDHNRVLIWNTPPTSPSDEPSVVLGQKTNYFVSMLGTLLDEIRGDSLLIPEAWNMRTPSGVCSDGTRLAVADRANHRVLIWNQIPTRTGQDADLVLGQTNFNSATANYLGISDKSLSSPASCRFVGTRLYVVDSGNHRVLFWDGVPTQNFEAADGVLGQPSFLGSTANNPSRLATSMSGPSSVLAYSGKLLVADRSNHRVLVWNTPLPASLQGADYVLGQASFIVGGGNPGGIGQRNFNAPNTVDDIDGSLYVTDENNSRILVWNSMPPDANTNADLVIGKPDFTTTDTSPRIANANNLEQPSGAATDGTRLYIADYGNNRLLIYNSLPSAPNPAADTVWGHVALDHSTVHGGGNPSSTLNVPIGFADDGAHHWIVDMYHFRAIRFPVGRTPFDGSTPDLVLGQTSLSANTISAASASTFSRPSSIASDGTQVYVADTGGNRILIYTTYPAADGASADAVLGQANMTATGSGVGTNSFNQPSSVVVSGGKLFVADTNNNRVLIWNSLPAANTAADVVLGQLVLGVPNFTTNTMNNGGVSANSMARPSDLHVYGTKLFVTDRWNQRVLIWNTIPTLGTEPADVIIGQTTAATNSYDAGQASQNAVGLNGPAGVAYAGGKFFVADRGNNRVLVWNTLPTVSGTPADAVYGQHDLVSANKPASGLSNRTLDLPLGLALVDGDLWVADSSTNRVLRFPNAD